MDILSRDRRLLLSEAGNYGIGMDNDYLFESELYDGMYSTLEEELSLIPELDESFNYYEEMVNIIETHSDYLPQYLVEFDSVIKLMESKGYSDEIDALNALAEHYGIFAGDLGILIESEYDINEAMEEIGAKGDSMMKDDAKHGALRKIKDLKDKGIAIVKKPFRKIKSKIDERRRRKHGYSDEEDEFDDSFDESYFL